MQRTKRRCLDRREEGVMAGRGQRRRMMRAASEGESR